MFGRSIKNTLVLSAIAKRSFSFWWRHVCRYRTPHGSRVRVRSHPSVGGLGYVYRKRFAHFCCSATVTLVSPRSCIPAVEFAHPCIRSVTFPGTFRGDSSPYTGLAIGITAATPLPALPAKLNSFTIHVQVVVWCCHGPILELSVLLVRFSAAPPSLNTRRVNKLVGSSIASVPCSITCLSPFV